MALKFNTNLDIITSDDRIIRNVGYVFLKPYFSSKDEVEIECVMYSDKTDVFPESVITIDEEGNEITTTSQTKGPKGSLRFSIVATMTDDNLVEKIHTLATEKLKELNPSIQLSADEV